MDGLETRVAAKAVYREVLDAAPVMEAWSQQITRIFDLCKAAPFPEKSEEFIRPMLNGDPDADIVTHWCVRGVCRCGGARDFRKKMRKAVMAFCGDGQIHCELYRWKNFEVASAWQLRTTLINNILTEAIEGIYKQKDLDNAEAVLLDAERLGQNDMGAKQTVRAGKYLKWAQGCTAKTELVGRDKPATTTIPKHCLRGGKGIVGIRRHHAVHSKFASRRPRGKPA